MVEPVYYPKSWFSVKVNAPIDGIFIPNTDEVVILTPAGLKVLDRSTLKIKDCPLNEKLFEMDLIALHYRGALLAADDRQYCVFVIGPKCTVYRSFCRSIGNMEDKPKAVAYGGGTVVVYSDFDQRVFTKDGKELFRMATEDKIISADVYADKFGYVEDEDGMAYLVKIRGDRAEKVSLDAIANSIVLDKTSVAVAGKNYVDIFHYEDLEWPASSISTMGKVDLVPIQSGMRYVAIGKDHGSIYILRSGLPVAQVMMGPYLATTKPIFSALKAPETIDVVFAVEHSLADYQLVYLRLGELKP